MTWIKPEDIKPEEKEAINKASDAMIRVEDWTHYCDLNALSSHPIKDEKLLRKAYEKYIEDSAKLEKAVEAKAKEKERSTIIKGYQPEEDDEDLKNVSINTLQYLAYRRRPEATEEVVKYILSKNHIYTIRSDETIEMWIYDDGVYKPEAQTYIKETCRKIAGPQTSNSFANDVITKIEMDTYINQKDFFITYIDEVAVQNGLLNVLTRELKSFDPNRIHFVKLPASYIPKADCLVFKKHLKNILENDGDIDVMQEIFGYTLLKDYKFEKAFMFCGGGRNGKGKTLEVLKRFLGIENTSSVTLSQIETDMYAMSHLHNKMANLCDDISPTYMKETGNFKSLTGHGQISASRKYKIMIEFTNFAKLIFCANEKPGSRDATTAFFNRWIVLNFPFTFLDQKEIDAMIAEGKDITNIKVADKEIISKLTTSEEMSGILNFALDGLDRLLSKKQFSFNKTLTEVKQEWIRETDSLQAFVDECCEYEFTNKILKSDFKGAYMKYCCKYKVSAKGDKWLKEVLSKKGAWETKSGPDHYWNGLKVKDVESVKEFDMSDLDDKAL